MSLRFLCALFLFALVLPIAHAADDAPPLKVTTLDGTEFDLAAQRGKWVVVNFWATWCSPCIKEMPEISAFDAAHDDVVAIGLSYADDSEDELREFLARHPIVYPVARFDPFEVPDDFDAPRGLPTTWLVDPEGRIAQKFVGPITAVDLKRAIGDAP